MALHGQKQMENKTPLDFVNLYLRQLISSTLYLSLFSSWKKKKLRGREDARQKEEGRRRELLVPTAAGLKQFVRVSFYSPKRKRYCRFMCGAGVAGPFVHGSFRFEKASQDSRVRSSVAGSLIVIDC